MFLLVPLALLALIVLFIPWYVYMHTNDTLRDIRFVAGFIALALLVLTVIVSTPAFFVSDPPNGYIKGAAWIGAYTTLYWLEVCALEASIWFRRRRTSSY